MWLTETTSIKYKKTNTQCYFSSTYIMKQLLASLRDIVDSHSSNSRPWKQEHCAIACVPSLSSASVIIVRHNWVIGTAHCQITSASRAVCLCSLWRQRANLWAIKSVLCVVLVFFFFECWSLDILTHDCSPLTLVRIVSCTCLFPLLCLFISVPVVITVCLFLCLQNKCGVQVRFSSDWFAWLLCLCLEIYAPFRT